MYVAGWTDTAANTRSAFKMTLDGNYPWDRIDECLYSMVISNPNDFFFTPVLITEYFDAFY